MIVVGAKGMAKELLEIIFSELQFKEEEILFFDNLNNHQGKLYGKFSILKSFEEVEDYFKNNNNSFTLGLGNPQLRQKMVEKFTELGGLLTSIVSSKAKIGSFNTSLGKGCQIMQGVVITNDVKLGMGVLVNLNTTISHDCEIGDYTEIACGVTIPGRCKIGNNVFIGSNATLNPDITIGDNAIIGAGSVVIKNVPEGCTVVGNPAKPIQTNE
jgi:sugar O-acyltransferase (sialic acid O-acetyltransferase NeuD family)